MKGQLGGVDFFTISVINYYGLLTWILARSISLKLMMDLFLTNMQLFASQDTGVV